MPNDPQPDWLIAVICLGAGILGLFSLIVLGLH